MEYLILKTNGWMDVTAIENPVAFARLTALRNNPIFEGKFNRRQRSGDIIEQQKDGYWTGANARGFRRDKFVVVFVPGLIRDELYSAPLTEIDKKTNERITVRKHEYSIDVSGLSIIGGIVSITEAEFESRLRRHG